MISKVLLVAFLSAGAKDWCWISEHGWCWTWEFCGDSECVKGFLGPIYQTISMLVSVVLAGIVMDDVYGWTILKQQMMAVMMRVRNFMVELITRETPVEEFEMVNLNNNNSHGHANHQVSHA